LNKCYPQLKIWSTKLYVYELLAVPQTVADIDEEYTKILNDISASIADTQPNLKKSEWYGNFFSRLRSQREVITSEFYHELNCKIKKILDDVSVPSLSRLWDLASTLQQDLHQAKTQEHAKVILDVLKIVCEK
jgi:hypothetical protein